MKKDNGHSLSSEIEGVEIPKELTLFAEDLVRMHRII